VPHRAVAGRFDLGDRQSFVGAFQFLQASDVGLLTVEPLDQARQARANAIHIEGREFHQRRLAAVG